MKYTHALSNTRLKVRVNRKSNPSVAKTVQEASNHEGWKHIGKALSGGTRSYASVNLTKINNSTTEGDTVVIPGKVLGSGDITKKVRIVSLSISDSAKEKLKKTKSEYATILEEIKINNKAQGLKIIQ